MSNPPDSPKESRAQEAAAIRRRWITLGEILAVIAVLISAVTLYLNWADKREERADKAAESHQASTRAGRLALNAASVSNDRIDLKPADPDQNIQSQTILFPKALGLAPVETTGDPRVEANWFEKALKKARSQAKRPDDSIGDERLPVAIITRFVVDGDAHEATALYDIGYGISGGWIAGHSVKLRGISHVKTLAEAGAQGAVDARWATVNK